MRFLKAVIFDVDGTLAETESRGHLTAFNRAFEELELPWRWGTSRYAELLEIGGGKERLAHFLAQQDSSTDAAGRLGLAEKIHRCKTKHYRQIVATGELPLRAGVRRLIASATEFDVRLAIATTSSELAVKSLLESTLGGNALDHFDTIAAGDAVERKKPAPDIYDYALRQLGIDATSAVAIEDSRLGMRAALDANLPVIVTPSEFTRNHDFAGATAVVDHLGDPGSACRQRSGCVDLQPMVTLENIEQLLLAAQGIGNDDA